MQKSKISVQDICSIAIMTAITVVMAQISIPMPMGVPMTMQTFAITLAGVILGSKKGGLSILVELRNWCSNVLYYHEQLCYDRNYSLRTSIYSNCDY